MPERDPPIALHEPWLVHLHGDRCAEADGDGVDLREVSQLARGAGSPRSSGADLRLLGLPAGVAGGGVRDLPAAIRDRDELPPDARGSDPDDDATAGGAPA